MNNTNNTTNEWSKRDIGALWKREGKNQKYLSGYVKVDELGIERELKVVVFSNKNKKDNDKAPDYRIYVSKPVTAQTEPAKTEPASKKKKASDIKEAVSDDNEDLL